MCQRRILQEDESTSIIRWRRGRGKEKRREQGESRRATGTGREFLAIRRGVQIYSHAYSSGILLCPRQHVFRSPILEDVGPVMASTSITPGVSILPRRNCNANDAYRWPSKMRWTHEGRELQDHQNRRELRTRLANPSLVLMHAPS